MSYKQFKEELLKKDKVLKKEYDKRDIAFEISKMIIEARLFKGLTQKKLATLMGTKQPSIARIESGGLLPSIAYLEKMASAMDAQLEIPTFNFDHAEVRTIKVNAQQNTLLEGIAGIFPNGFAGLHVLMSSNPTQKPISANF